MRTFSLTIFPKSLLTTDNAILLAILSCVATILWFAAQLVEPVWCHTDVALTSAMFVLSFMGVVFILIKNTRIMLSQLDYILFIWMLYVIGYAYLSASYPCATFCLRVMQMMLLYVALRLLFTAFFMREEYLVLPIFLYGLWEAWLGVHQVLQGNSRHYLYPLTGSFLNPGPYSAILAMGLVMALCWYRTYSAKFSFFKWQVNFGNCLFLPVCAFAILLLATWSRAALLSTIICVGIIFWKEWKRWLGWVVALGVMLGLGLYSIKTGSANGRSVIFFLSLLNITHHPIFGAGIGSFFHQYAEEMARFNLGESSLTFQSADVLDYTFNDLLRIGVEQGLTGVAFAVSVLMLTFRSLESKGRVLRMGLLSLLIFSLFSYPFELLPYQLIMVLILAYAGTPVPIVIHKGWKGQILYRYFFPIFCLMVTIPIAWFISHQIEKRAKAEANYKLIAGIQDVAFLDDYYEMLPLLTENRRFLFDFAKLLAQQGRYNDSNAILRQGTLVSNDPMFFVLQGNNYKGMEDYAEAEATYQKAYSILPNRIYPLYQLMCLYEQMGNPQKTKQMAKRVFEFNVKVESPATREMKENARQRLIEK